MRVDILLTSGKHLHDDLISRRGGFWHKTIELSVPIKERDWSRVFEISIFPLFTYLLSELFREWDIFIIGNLLVSFDLYYSIILVTTFIWPPTRDTRNYQLLVICHARSNVTSLNLSLKTKSQSCVKIVKLPIETLLVLKKRSIHNKKNHKAVLKLWNYRKQHY